MTTVGRDEDSGTPGEVDGVEEMVIHEKKVEEMTLSFPVHTQLLFRMHFTCESKCFKKVYAHIHVLCVLKSFHDNRYFCDMCNKVKSMHNNALNEINKQYGFS